MDNTDKDILKTFLLSLDRAWEKIDLFAIKKVEYRTIFERYDITVIENFGTARVTVTSSDEPELKQYFTYNENLVEQIESNMNIQAQEKRENYQKAVEIFSKKFISRIINNGNS